MYKKQLTGSVLRHVRLYNWTALVLHVTTKLPMIEEVKTQIAQEVSAILQTSIIDEDAFLLARFSCSSTKDQAVNTDSSANATYDVGNCLEGRERTSVASSHTQTDVTNETEKSTSTRHTQTSAAVIQETETQTITQTSSPVSWSHDPSEAEVEPSAPPAEHIPRKPRALLLSFAGLVDLRPDKNSKVSVQVFQTINANLLLAWEQTRRKLHIVNSKSCTKTGEFSLEHVDVVRDLCAVGGDDVAIAADNGLFILQPSQTYRRIFGGAVANVCCVSQKIYACASKAVEIDCFEKDTGTEWRQTSATKLHACFGFSGLQAPTQHTLYTCDGLSANLQKFNFCADTSSLTAVEFVRPDRTQATADIKRVTDERGGRLLLLTTEPGLLYEFDTSTSTCRALTRGSDRMVHRWEKPIKDAKYCRSRQRRVWLLFANNHLVQYQINDITAT